MTYDSRLEQVHQPLYQHSLTLMSELRYLNKDITALSKIKTVLKSNLDHVNIRIKTLLVKSKDIQTLMFEQADEITKLTATGKRQSAALNYKETNHTITPNFIECHIDSLPPDEKEAFISALIAKL